MKTIRRTWYILIAFFMIVTSFYATPSVQAISQNDDTITQDGIDLSKKATLVDGYLNKWKVELGLSFEHKAKSQDIVVIIDKSGSMKDNNRMKNAKTAAKDFVNIVLDSEKNHNNRIALISYSTGASVDVGFTSNKGTLISAIDNLSADGGTFTQLALKKARELLDGSNANEKIVVLLTDGAPTFGFNLSGNAKNLFNDNSKTNSDTKNGYSEYKITKNNNGSYSYGTSQSIFTGKQNILFLKDHTEQNLLESDFDYNDMGGHGNDALKYVAKFTSRHGLLNLFNTNIAEAKIVKNKGNTLYTIALDLGSVANAEATLQEMATSPNHYFKASSSNLKSKFEEIAGSIAFPYSDMELIDKMGNGVDFVANSIEENNIQATTTDRRISVNLNPSQFTYNKDTNRYEFKMTYFVVANEDAVDAYINSDDGLIDTNEEAYFSYKDNGTHKSPRFPKPRVKPTILKVDKTLLDEDGNKLSLEDNRLQRLYNFTITDSDGNVIDRISTKHKYFILQKFEERTITETSITNDDISRFDTSIKYQKGNDSEKDLPDGKFKLQPKSGMNTIRLINKAKKDHQYDLEVDKSVNDKNENGYAEKNETLSYTIHIENTTGKYVRDVFIKDDLADIIDYIDIDNTTLILSRNGHVDNTYTSLNDLMSGFVTHMAKDDKITITFDVVVKDDKPLPQFLKNTVKVNHLKADANIETGEPIISAEKSVLDDNGDKLAEAGEKLHYTIKITNSGKVEATNLHVKDTLSDLLPHIDDISGVKMLVGGTEMDLQKLISGITVNVPANKSLTIKFTVKVKDDFDADDVDVLHNLATVGDEEPETEIPTGKSRIVAKKFVKDGNHNGHAEAGEELHYTIKVKNTGNIKKKDVKIQDTLENLLPYIDDVSDLTMSLNDFEAPLSNLIDGFTRDIGAHKTLYIRFTVKVKDDFDASEVDTLHNLATVDDKEPEAEIPTGKSEIEIVKSVTDKSEDGFAEAGEELYYTISVNNKGNLKKDKVHVQDTLENLLPYIEDISNTELTAYPASNSRTLQDLVDGFDIDLDAQEGVSFAFTVKLKDDFDADEISILKNTATADEASDDAEIPTGKAKISISKSVEDDNGDGLAEAGEMLHYTISIKNTGNVETGKLTLQDELKELLPYIDDIDNVEVYIDGQKHGYLELLIKGWNVTMLPGSSMDFTFSVKVKDDFDADAVGTLTNIATFGDKEADAKIDTGKPKVSITKSIRDSNGNDIAEAGEMLHYTISIKNTGKVKTGKLTLQDELKELLPYIDDIDNVEVYIDGQKHGYLESLIKGWNVTMLPGSSMDFTFSVKVKDDFDADAIGTLTNIATIGDEEAEAKIPTGKANITADKTVVDDNGDGYAEAGENLHYTIDIENTGKVKKSDLFIQDDLKDLLEHIDDITDVMMDINGTERPLQDLIDGFEVDLNANSTLSISFTLRVKDDFDADDVDTLHNLATVGNETPEAKIPTGRANITADKTVVDDNGDGYAEAGENLHYTIDIENTGKVKKSDLFIQDDLKDLLEHIDDITDVMMDINGIERPLQDLVDGFEVDLNANSTLSISFTLRVKDDFEADDVDTLHNLATVGNETPEAKIPTGKADLVLEKYVLDDNQNMAAELGETLHYAIIVVNNGDVIKRDVFVQDTLENLLPYIDDITGVMMDVNGVERPLQDLIDGFYVDVEKGNEIIISFDVKVKDELDDIDVRSLINIASADDLKASAEIRLEIALEAHVEPKPDPKPDKPAPTKGDARLPLTGYVNLSLILGTCFIGLGLILVLIRRRREKA